MNETEPETLDSEAAFQTALQELLSQCSRNDLDPKGGWMCEIEGETRSWDVLITEVDGERSRDGEERPSPEPSFADEPP